MSREFPPRAQSHRVVLSRTMDSCQYRNRRETSIQHRLLHNEANVTMTECSDLPQFEWLVGQKRGRQQSWNRAEYWDIRGWVTRLKVVNTKSTL